MAGSSSVEIVGRNLGSRAPGRSSARYEVGSVDPDADPDHGPQPDPRRPSRLGNPNGRSFGPFGKPLFTKSVIQVLRSAFALSAWAWVRRPAFWAWSIRADAPATSASISLFMSPFLLFALCDID